MNEIKTDTRGSAVVTRIFLEYQESVGQIDALFRGKLISMVRNARLSTNVLLLHLFVLYVH